MSEMFGTAFVTKTQVFQSGTGITKCEKRYYKASNKYY